MCQSLTFKCSNNLVFTRCIVLLQCRSLQRSLGCILLGQKEERVSGAVVTQMDSLIIEKLNISLATRSCFSLTCKAGSGKELLHSQAKHSDMSFVKQKQYHNSQHYSFGFGSHWLHLTTNSNWYPSRNCVRISYYWCNSLHWFFGCHKCRLFTWTFWHVICQAKAISQFTALLIWVW